jgi:hypothetical protein
MRRFAWGLGVILLALILVAAGCSSTPASTTTTPATTTPAVKTPVTTSEGTVTDVNPKTSSVTVETPKGPETVKVTPTTQISLNGNTCSLDQLDATLAASGQSYDCTVVTDETGNVVSVNVVAVAPVASVKGTISDVNIKDSTVTVKTGSGDKVYDVDPSTGLLIGGVACSLDLVNALVDAGGQLPCTVIYSTNDKGTAQYIDIANPPNSTITEAVGTVTSVDVQKSTVTIQTDKGPRTFTTNAKTGEFLNGEVCSLTDVQAAGNEGGGFSACQVVYYTDASGNLVYIDISQQPPPAP